MPLARRDWPFLARAEELQLIRAAVLDEARGALVAGPAGVGKSRLLRELVAEAADRGVRTWPAIATRAARETPYGALAHLLPDPAQGPEDVGSWYRSVSAALRPAEGPVPLLAVDDAHLLDDNSAALLLHLALTGAARVVVTVRRGEPVPDAVTTLWKDDLALRIDLQPLSPAETGAIIEAGLGGEVAAETRNRLAEVSGGNVLFARELVFGAVDAGSLRRTDGVWRWDGSVVLAPRLVDAVSQRIGDLDAAARTALAVLALAEPVSTRRLAGLAGVVEEGAVERLEALGLVAAARPADGEVSFRPAHPLYGEVVLDALGAAGQRRLTRQLARALESSGRVAPEDVVRLATWRLDLGGEVDPDLLTRAAIRACRAFDPDLGERLARAAIDRGGPPRASVALALACNARNRFAESERVLAAVEERILAEDDLELHQVYLDRRHAALFMGLDRREEALAMLDRFDAAHRASAEPHRSQARLLASGYRAQILMEDGRLEEALAATRETLARGSDAGPLPTFHALWVAGEALAYQGRTHTARAEIHPRLHRLGETGGAELRMAPATAVLQEITCLALEGRVAQALPLAEAIHAAAAEDPDPHVGALVALVLGGVQLQRGLAASARRTLLDAVDGFRRRDSGHASAWAMAMLAEVEAHLGNVAAARSRLAEAERQRGRSPRIRYDLGMARALVRHLEGDRTGAVRTALAAAEELGELRVPRARMLHGAVRLGAPAGAAAEGLRALAAGAESGYPGLLLDHVDALAAEDGLRLAEVAARFEDNGELVLAAEAYGQAARAHRSGGDRRSAQREERRSRTLAARCEGVVVPGPWRAPAPDVPQISRRELEVARLVAGGLSNADVARRLTLSVRTVESHLYQAYAKLGVRGRQELADALRDGQRDDG